MDDEKIGEMGGEDENESERIKREKYDCGLAQATLEFGRHGGAPIDVELLDYCTLAAEGKFIDSCRQRRVDDE